MYDRQIDTDLGMVWGVCDRMAKASQSTVLATKRNAINTLHSLDTAMNLMQGALYNGHRWDQRFCPL